jgi:hypothetical protein
VAREGPVAFLLGKWGGFGVKMRVLGVNLRDFGVKIEIFRGF